MKRLMVVFCALRLAHFAAAADETAALQGAIDEAAANGGGVVRVEAGLHEVGGLRLKSNVTLELAEGARLLFSTNAADYASIPIEWSEIKDQTANPWRGLVHAVGATNVAVVGKGTIDGNGRGWACWAKGRPRGLLFKDCRDVRIEGVTLYEIPSWGCYLKECDGVAVKGLRIDSHNNVNNDGLDIESRNVVVEDCEFDCGDDALCFKSDNPDFIVENVEVRNCRLASTCNAFKFGTRTFGMIRNVLADGLSIVAPKRSFVRPGTDDDFYIPRKLGQFPGSKPTSAAISGIAVECVDGGVVSNIVVRNVTMDGVLVPLFVRGGLRSGESGVLHDLLVENVRAKAGCWTASSITGVAGCRVDGVMLRNITLVVPGGADEELAKADVPEKTGNYPDANMFGGILPAHGLYVRHADNVRLESVRITTIAPEMRPAIIAEDAHLEQVAAVPWEDPQVSGINKLEARAVLVPCETEAKARAIARLEAPREASDYVVSLNGEYEDAQDHRRRVDVGRRRKS